MQRNVLEYLEEAAARCPEKAAFTDEEEALSYRELVTAAKTIASFLVAHTGGAAGQPVAVFCGRNIRSLAAFFGAVYSGNFYVPIDGKLPAERIRTMLDTLQPAAVIAADGGGVAEDVLPPGCAVFSYEEMLDAPLMEEELAQRRRGQLDTDPLYAIFTSGSTGTPKGVLVSHRSVIDLVEQFEKVFAFGPQVVFGNQAPFDFDISVKDIYMTLKCGGTLHVLPKSFFISPIKLIRCLNGRKINTLIWSVSAMRILENLKAFRKERPQYLQKILFSGETMPCRVLNYWRSSMPETTFVNVYGPTEITCNCTYYIVDREYPDDGVLPIGEPFENTGILLLAEDGMPAACGEIGEICVKGTCLALGYYRDPERTAQAFCQNPLHGDYPERIYRTGDLGRRDAAGQLYYVSRADHQIKHMGHRIELGELEAAAMSLSAIEAACCIFDRQANKILMFYQAEEACDMELIAALGKKLPKYMCPNRVIWQRALPLNKNGKLDRVALQRQVESAGEGSAEGMCAGEGYSQVILVGGSQLAKRCLSVIEASGKAVFLNVDTASKEEVMQALSAVRERSLVLSIMNPYLFTKPVLGNPNLRIVNLHHGILPGHRGRNAQAWALFYEDSEAGFTWHLVDAGVDTGGILQIERFPIEEEDTSLSLLRKQNERIPESLRKLLPGLLADKLPVQKPAERADYLHLSRDIPGGGVLDLAWSGHKMSCFLRAMDFGILRVLGMPSVEWQGEKFHFKAYRIEKPGTLAENPQAATVSLQGEDLEILRDEYRIRLCRLSRV